jgi:hypothetical protein
VKNSSSVAIDTVPLPERPIRVSIPARAAFNIEDFQNVLANLAERLGHPECLSGHSCLFEMEREFVVNPADLRVHGVSEALRGK